MYLDHVPRDHFNDQTGQYRLDHDRDVFINKLEVPALKIRM